MSRSKDWPSSTYVELRCTMPERARLGHVSIIRAVGPRAELAPASRQEDVVGLGLADGDPHALAGERADGDAGLLGERDQLGRPVAERQPDEVALRLGEASSPGPSARRPRARARRRSRRPAPSAPASAPRLATAAACATLETPNGSAHARTAAATSSWATSVADPEAGQPVGLGEGAHHRDVGVRRRPAPARRPGRPRGRTRGRPRRPRPARGRAPARRRRAARCS